MNEAKIEAALANLERQVTNLRRDVRGECISMDRAHDWVTGRSGMSRQCRTCGRFHRLPKAPEPANGVAAAGAYARMRTIEEAPDYTRAIVVATISTVVEVLEKNLVLGPLTNYLDDDLSKRLRVLRENVAGSSRSADRGSPQ